LSTFHQNQISPINKSSLQDGAYVVILSKVKTLAILILAPSMPLMKTRLEITTGSLALRALQGLILYCNHPLSINGNNETLTTSETKHILAHWLEVPEFCIIVAMPNTSDLHDHRILLTLPHIKFISQIVDY
jgi:hypothetical protein